MRIKSSTTLLVIVGSCALVVYQLWLPEPQRTSVVTTTDAPPTITSDSQPSASSGQPVMAASAALH